VQSLLTTDEVAQILNLDTQTLTNWRKSGIGPPAMKLNYRTVRYDPEALADWLLEQGTTGQHEKNKNQTNQT